MNESNWEYRSATFYTIFEVSMFLNKESINTDWVIYVGYNPHATDGKCYDLLYIYNTVLDNYK